MPPMSQDMRQKYQTIINHWEKGTLTKGTLEKNFKRDNTFLVEFLQEIYPLVYELIPGPLRGNGLFIVPQILGALVDNPDLFERAVGGLRSKLWKDLDPRKVYDFETLEKGHTVVELKAFLKHYFQDSFGPVRSERHSKPVIHAILAAMAQSRRNLPRAEVMHSSGGVIDQSPTRGRTDSLPDSAVLQSSSAMPQPVLPAWRLPPPARRPQDAEQGIRPLQPGPWSRNYNGRLPLNHSNQRKEHDTSTSPPRYATGYFDSEFFTIPPLQPQSQQATQRANKMTPPSKNDRNIQLTGDIVKPLNFGSANSSHGQLATGKLQGTRRNERVGVTRPRGVLNIQRQIQNVLNTRDDWDLTDSVNRLADLQDIQWNNPNATRISEAREGLVKEVAERLKGEIGFDDRAEVEELVDSIFSFFFAKDQ
ncbi:hypothetical protein SLS60_010849 [Paraconiothyrium brasiliense]|uniref:Uncharacterized protein n=1 Tax=Paraconiothyrium brasiliense TaxID=300254 RepID=A0ABR3QM66_9PLEO